MGVIGELIVGIEKREGKRNVGLEEKERVKRLFERFEEKKVIMKGLRGDWGWCCEEIVEEIGKEWKRLYMGGKGWSWV